MKATVERGEAYTAPKPLKAGYGLWTGEAWFGVELPDGTQCPMFFNGYLKAREAAKTYSEVAGVKLEVERLF